MSLPLNNILTYIDHHFASLHGVGDVAAAFGMKEERLRRLFAKEVGRPFAQHLRELRVERARWLLDHTQLSAKQVCHHVGWRAEAGGRTFKEATGVTMRQYRE